MLLPDCPKAESRIEAVGAALVERWLTQCKLATVRIDGLDRTLTDVMLELNSIDSKVQRALLRPERTSYELGTGSSGSAALYLQLGVEHLLSGYDHLLFVLGLLLLISTKRTLLITVTCFTLAHSVTLALSVLGWVRLAQAPVEAGIALSIVLLALEVLRPGSSILKSKPWLAALAFGLLHGFGFASALRQIGLPSDGLLVALLSFNIGIELGQLLVIAAWIFVGFVAARLPLRGITMSQLRPVAAYAIGGVAVFWVLQRTLPLVDTALQAG
jgi:hydrogenase/urease accessory protein HupE